MEETRWWFGHERNCCEAAVSRVNGQRRRMVEEGEKVAGMTEEDGELGEVAGRRQGMRRRRRKQNFTPEASISEF